MLRMSTLLLLAMALLAIFPLLGAFGPAAAPAHPVPVPVAKPALHHHAAHRATVAPLARVCRVR